MNMPVVLEELRQYHGTLLPPSPVVLRKNTVPMGQLIIKGTASYSNTVVAVQSVFGSALGFYPIHMLFEQMNLV